MTTHRAISLSTAVLAAALLGATTAAQSAGGPVASTVMGPVNTLPNNGRPKTRIPFPGIKNWQSLVIKLSRTGCFGTCPAYHVEVHGDGRVVYVGGSDVAVDGQHIAHISTEAVRQLFERFRAADFFWLLGDYRAPVSDLPQQMVSISFDGHAKTVFDYAGPMIGMPKEVSDLEAEIDRVAGTSRWVVGTAETVPALRAEGWDFHAPRNAHLLSLVAENGPPEVVRDLVLAGAPVDGLRHAGGWGFQLTPLAYAAQRGELDLVKFLIAHGADVNRTGLEERTVLIAAAHSGRPDVVAEILRHRPHVNASDHDGMTALVAAASSAYSEEPHGVDRPAVVRMLIAAGANVRAVDAQGNTVLMAVISGPVTKTLIAAGANPNARNHDGETPLSKAYDSGQAQVLLEAGADPWAKLPDGRFAYEHARENMGDVAVVIDKWMATHPRSGH